MSVKVCWFFFLPPKNQPQCSFEEGLCGCGRSFIWVYLLFICLAAPLTFLFSLAQHGVTAALLPELSELHFFSLYHLRSRIYVSLFRKLWFEFLLFILNRQLLWSTVLSFVFVFFKTQIGCHSQACHWLFQLFFPHKKNAGCSLMLPKKVTGRQRCFTIWLLCPISLIKVHFEWV